MSSVGEGAPALWSRTASNALGTLWSRPIGQTLLRHVDRLLWSLEKAHQWSVPPNPDKPNTGSNGLTRPIPWIVFLPLLAVLRICREGASFAALLLGKEPIRPADIVKFIQQRRRAVRALKFQGTRAMRARAHHSRGAQRRSWMGLITGPIGAVISVATGWHLLEANNKAHSERDDASDRKSQRRQDTDENLLEKLLQNADLSDNTSTDDSAYTLKNASDSEDGSTSSENGDNTVEEIQNLQNNSNGPMASSSEKDPEECNTTFILSEAAEDEQPHQAPNQTAALSEEESTNNGPTVTPGVLCSEGAASPAKTNSSSTTPAEEAKESTQDILDAERAASAANCQTKATSPSNAFPKEGPKNKSPRIANGDAIRPKDAKARRDSPSKLVRKGSVPVVRVTAADEKETNDISREGSYRNVPQSTERVEVRVSPAKGGEATINLQPHPPQIQETKQTPRQKNVSAVPVSETKTKIKRPFWRWKKSPPLT